MTEIIITRVEAQAQGLLRFFTGLPCRNGHVAPRYVADNGRCVECKQAKCRRYVAVHFEERRDYHREWESKNRERVRQRSETARRAKGVKPQVRISAAEKRAKALIRQREWTNRNPERRREIYRKSRERNPDRYREWYNTEAAKLVVQANGRRRRARQLGAQGDHTDSDLHRILKAQSHRCAYCRTDLRKAGRHLDHITPLALGGSNAPDNLQYLCPPCNLSKGAKDPLTFAQERGFLL